GYIPGNVLESLLNCKLESLELEIFNIPENEIVQMLDIQRQNLMILSLHFHYDFRRRFEDCWRPEKLRSLKLSGISMITVNPSKNPILTTLILVKVDLTNSSLMECLERAPNLEVVMISNIASSFRLDLSVFEICKGLKHLELEDLHCRKCELKEFSNLETLKVDFFTNHILKEIKAPKLKHLMLNKTGVEFCESCIPDNFSRIKRLTFTGYSNISILFFLKNLKYLE
uniref:Uncharacterized protein n=1 Tax=Megaselia scalaris TaxID=36166 RepID=T1H5B3_MEGSC